MRIIQIRSTILEINTKVLSWVALGVWMCWLLCTLRCWCFEVM